MNSSQDFELIENYKKVLRMANVPEFLIEHPEFINSIPPTQADLDWANKCYQEITNKEEKARLATIECFRAFAEEYHGMNETNSLMYALEAEEEPASPLFERIKNIFLNYETH